MCVFVYITRREVFKHIKVCFKEEQKESLYAEVWTLKPLSDNCEPLLINGIWMGDYKVFLFACWYTLLFSPINSIVLFIVRFR